MKINFQVKPFILFAWMLFILLYLQGCSDMGDEVMRKSSGYKGGIRDWEKFLFCWEREVKEKLKGSIEDQTDEEVAALRETSIRSNPASLEDIEEIEDRLKTRLPQSYKDFILVSNGWIVDFYAFDNEGESVSIEDSSLLPIQEIGWVMDKVPDVLSAWNSGIDGDWGHIDDLRYFDYSPNQDPLDMRNKYLKDTLVLSNDINSGFYLLNPNIKFSDGEWEAWYFSWKHPGALRFKSFAHLMRYAYYRFNQNPEGDGVYPEDKLAKTCANLLPVTEEDYTTG